MADKVIRYRGEFDASNILASLKNIRSEMQKNGADSALFGNVDKDIQKAESLMRDLQAQIKTGFRNQKDIDNFEKKFQTLNQTLSKVNVGLGDIAKPENFKIQSKELDNLNKQIQKNIQAQEELGKAAKEAVEGFSTKAMKKELNDAIDKGEKLEETLKKIGEQQFSSRQGTLSKRLSKFTPNEINGAMDAGKVGNNLNLSDKGLTKYQEALKAIAVQGQNVREVFEALKNNLDNSDKEILESSDFVKQYTGDIAALIEALRKVPNKGLEAGNADKALREMTYGGAIDLNGEFQINKESVDSIVKLQEEYGKLAPLQEKLKQLEEELAAEREKNANIAVNGLTAAGNAQNRVAEETDKATQATREQMAAQEATNRTFDNIKNTITRLTSLTAIVSTVTREIKETAHIIQDLDKAFGQIAMVTDYSIEDMWSKYQSYADLANKLGQSTLSVVQASGLYFQQGLEEAEALQLTESTMKLATLAGLDFQQATSLMTSAVRGFHMEMSEGEHVTDVYSELAAHAAASVEGIANAMSRTAAIASSAGMEFETTAAMLTTMIEATQESPETLGTAMKTVIARFTELKDNVSALDSEFDDLDYNKVDKALKSIGVSLKDTNGQFRDIDDVFLEVSERWDTLDRNTQRYIATTAAGSRQQSRFIALMENYDRTMELIETAQDSAGRSSEQFAKYQDTLENKVNRLKNSWEQLRLQFLKSDFLKTAVGLLNNLVISMNKVDPKKLLGLGVIGIAIGKNIALNLVDNVSKGIKNQQGKLSTAWGKVFTKVYEEKTNIIVGKYTEKLNAVKTEQGKINKELEEQNSKLESQERYYNLTSIKVEESKNLVEEIKNKIAQQNNEENEVTAELNRQLSLREQNLKTDEEELVKEQQELLIQQQKTEELKKQQNINNKKVTGLQGKINTAQGNLDENAKAASEMTSLVGSAVSSGIFVGITTFLASKDAKTSILAAGGTLVASLGPILLEKAITAGLEKLAGSAIIQAAMPAVMAAAPVLAAAAAVIIVSVIAKKYDEASNKITSLQQATEQLEKEQEELNKSAEKAAASSDFAKTTKENADSLRELIEGYEELSNKQFKTTEEQEKFDEIVNQIKEKYPDLISYENERTGEIRIQTDLLKEQLEIAQELSKNAEKKALLDEKRVNSDVYATTLSSIEVEKEQKKADYSEELAKKFADEVKSSSEYASDVYNDDQLQKIYQYFSGEIDFRQIQNEGIASNAKYLREHFLKAYQKIIKEDTGFEEIEKETEQEQQKAWYQYLESQRKAYANYATDLYNLDEEVADIITKQALIDPEKKLSKASVEIRDNFISEIGEWKDKTVKDYSRLALDSDYNSILAAIFGVDTTQEDWTAKLSEAMSSSNMDMGDLVADFTQMLNLGEVTDQIDNFWESIKDETYDGYLSLKEDILSGEMSYNELIGLELTGNEVLDDALKIQIDEARQNVRDIVLNRDNGISISELLGIASTDKTGQFLSFSDSDLDKISEQTAEGLKQVYQNIVDSLGKDATDADIRSVFGNFTDMLSNLNIEDVDIPQIMSLFNFEDIDATNFEQYSKQIQESIEGIEDSTGKAKYSAEEAQKIVSNVFSFAENNNIFSPYLDNFTELMNYMDAIPEKMKAIEDESDNIVGWVATADKNGLAKITTDEVSKLKELGTQLGINTEQYIKYDEKTKQYHVEAKSLYSDINKYLEDQLKLIDDSIENTDDESYKEDLKEQREILIELINTQKSELNVTAKMGENYSTLVSTISTLTSSYKTMSNEMLETGHISSSSYESLSDALTTITNSIGSFGVETKNITDFIYEQNGAVKLDTKSFYDYIDGLIDTLEIQKIFGESINEDVLNKLKLLRIELQETKQETEKANQEAWDTYNSDVQSKYEEWQEALDKIKEKEEAVAEAEEKVKEAEEELLETEEKLQEIYYGEANHKNKLDYLYNYATELEQLEKKAKDAAEALDNLSPDDDVHQKVEDYKNALADEIANYKAQNEVIKQYLANQKQMLDEGLSQRLEQLKAEGAVDTSTNVSDFYYERDGRWYVDYQKLNAAKLPDDVSDFIEEQVDNMNKYAKAYEDNLDKIEAARKEFEQRQKAARDKYIEVENKVVELLKKKDQEELDSLKNKYDGMKEADDEYTSALEESIKKQRDLRNQANQWDDLAEKEKKLSLQQRDTSGANVKEIKKTQDDITKTRESLLDNAVDNIVNNLKELYAEQEETRQAEIEYRQAILDNKNYVDEATAIINNWENAQDALDFFMEMDEQFNEASDATFSKLVDDVNGYYESSVYYYELAGQDFEDVVQQANEEANDKIRDTSETLTSESERALDETMDKVHEAQEKGREDVEAAKKAVEDAKQAVVDATKAVAEALEEARKKQEEYNEAIRNQPSPGGGGGNNGNGGNGNGGTDDENDDTTDTNTDNRSETEKANAVAQAVIKLIGGRDSNGNGKSAFTLDRLAQETDLSSSDAKDFLQKIFHGIVSDNKWVNIFKSREAAQSYFNGLPNDQKGGKYVFKTGGLVDYTGPAWVDGTPSKPEAFLSADDTRRIDILTNILSSLPAFDLNSLSKLSTLSNTIGDTTFNIDINVESISSDYDVDQMVERVHEDILSITNRPGTMVTLSR